jgi:hypothetical protein
MVTKLYGTRKYKADYDELEKEIQYRLSTSLKDATDERKAKEINFMMRDLSKNLRSINMALNYVAKMPMRTDLNWDYIFELFDKTYDSYFGECLNSLSEAGELNYYNKKAGRPRVHNMTLWSTIQKMTNIIEQDNKIADVMIAEYERTIEN